ncbi:hypothetical protein QJQ45_028999 [Haematococcus lacustris]|nr:hypothetical protein QJQ45_028999 [Haematococcus lacustris]
MHDMSVAHTTEVRQTWLRELPDGAGRLARILLAGLAALGGDIRPAIESIASLLAQYWVPLGMGAWGAKPQVPCDTRWASYISSTVTMLRVWAHARDAVSQLLERQKGMSPPWAVTLSQLLQDNSLLLRLSVVAVVGESFLVPELMWASKDDGLHAFELYRHTQDVLARLGTWDTLPLLACLKACLCQQISASSRSSSLRPICRSTAQMALPHLFAALGSSDQATRMEVAIDVVYHAELRLPPSEDGAWGPLSRMGPPQQDGAPSAGWSMGPPQQQLTRAGTIPELAVPAGAPPQQQQQLAAASTSRKRGAPAANKSRAAKQGATHNSVAKRASAARLACGEIA